MNRWDNNDMKIYFHKQESWNKAKCEKMARHVAKDGLGTPYPFKGYIGADTGPYAIGVTIRLNGGCVHDGVWHEAEIRPLPQVADGFEIVNVPRYGWRIVRK